MTLPAASGPITRAETLLAASLAACAPWQALCGAGSAAAALERIYFDALPPPPHRADRYTREQLEALRPFILIYSDEETTIHLAHVATGTMRRFHPDGVLKFYVERNVPAEEAHDPALGDRAFKNFAGQLALALCNLSGQANYLAIDDLTGNGPLRALDEHIPTRGDFQQFHFAVTWGGGRR
jgi:hypothetical protein